jgi:hypothetical protein
MVNLQCIVLPQDHAKTTVMKKHFSLVMIVALLSTSAIAQLKEQAKKLRDPAAEDAVAKLFENAREQSGAKKLGRIRYQEQAQALACSAALGAKSPRGTNSWASFGLYKTAVPTQVSDEITRLASAGKTGYSPSRYAVAVWRSASDNSEYWVEIRLYSSAAAEFFEDYLTDEMFYRNDWKKLVLPECLAKPPRPKPVLQVKKTIKLCVASIAEKDHLPHESIVDTLAMLGRKPMSGIALDVRTINMPLAQKGYTPEQIAGCEYILELGKEELRNNCYAAGSTVECLDTQKKADAQGRSNVGTTERSVPVWLYRSGEREPRVNKTVAELSPVDSLYSGIEKLAEAIIKDVVNATRKTNIVPTSP